MADVVSAKTRSRMMAGIKSKNTRPEMLVRKALFAEGYRFRLHRKDLPGTPDVVVPGRRLAVFVNGCFWHRHTGCGLAKLPATRPEFWREKLERNKARDLQAVSELAGLGWRVLIVWECFVRQQPNLQELGSAMSKSIESTRFLGELPEPSD